MENLNINEIILAVAMFTGMVLLLSGIILVARKFLVNSGNVAITLNGEKTISVESGGKLLQTLANSQIFLSSACGGGGTCGLR